MFRADLEHSHGVAASLLPAPFDPGEVARQRRVEVGDWQTPAELAGAVVAVVAGLEPGVRAVLEPTCGKGSFLVAARQAFPAARLAGYELSAEHAADARHALRGSEARVEVADFFETPWDEVIGGLPEPLAIVGNPPWVTSATLGVLSGTNLPQKSNFKQATGFDALTGKSNFDISEWMIRRLVAAARGRRFTLAMLCKASVARRLIERAAVEGWKLEGSVRAVDAHAHFSAAVSAVLVVLRGDQTSAATGPRWGLYPSLAAPTPTSRMAVAGGRAVRDADQQQRTALLEAGAAANERVWRSGVKHDLARVMELTRRGDALENGLGERVELEAAHVYPLLKGSDLGTERPGAVRSLVVTQTALGADTTALAESAPLTWRYLERHRPAFEARKSRIYRGQPPFAMFGIGPYSFAPYKVAISGLHKGLGFRVIGPRDGRPVLLDDTSYFLPFDDEATAREVARLLGSPQAREFFEARVFWDDKRPINKALLSSLSLEALARRLDGDTAARSSG
jgi:hypothetical protein